ncbi:hypothetical protein [Roseisolibacter agri]|nr:hypothetical protein [Roseisolibacter agri]
MPHPRTQRPIAEKPEPRICGCCATCGCQVFPTRDALPDVCPKCKQLWTGIILDPDRTLR